MQTYPMTPGQDIILVQQKYSYNKAVSNINMMMIFEFEIDDLLMKQALMQAILRNQAATIRVTKRDKETRQYFSSDMPEGVAWVDLSHLSPEAAEAEIESWGRKKFPNKNYDTQLYRAKLVVLPSGERAVYFCVSHLIFDAYALIATAGDMIDTYRALLKGELLPKPLPSPLPVYQQQWDYLKSDQLKQDQAFFRELFRDEPEFHSLNGRGSKEYMPGKRYGRTIRPWQIKVDFIDLRIPARLVKGIEELAYAMRVPTQVFYMLALRNYIAKIDDTEDITFNHTIARRGTLAQKRAGGTMVNSVLFRMQQTNDMTVSQAAESLSQYQMRLYRHTELPYSLFSYGIKTQFNLPHLCGYSTVGLTFQPYSVCQYEDMPIRMKRYNNGYGGMPTYITIMSVDNTGDLLCNYEYTLGFIREESIYNFHAYILTMFEHLIEKPDVTLQELVDLEIKPLEK